MLWQGPTSLNRPDTSVRGTNGEQNSTATILQRSEMKMYEVQVGNFCEQI